MGRCVFDVSVASMDLETDCETYCQPMTGEMSQQLRTLVALPEEPSSGPRIHVRYLKTICKSSSRTHEASFGLHRRQAGMWCIDIHADRSSTHRESIINVIKKEILQCFFFRVPKIHQNNFGVNVDFCSANSELSAGHKIMFKCS